VTAIILNENCENHSKTAVHFAEINPYSSLLVIKHIPILISSLNFRRVMVTEKLVFQFSSSHKKGRPDQTQNDSYDKLLLPLVFVAARCHKASAK
jgi:hypothetical protein